MHQEAVVQESPPIQADAQQKSSRGKAGLRPISKPQMPSPDSDLSFAKIVREEADKTPVTEEVYAAVKSRLNNLPKLKADLTEKLIRQAIVETVDHLRTSDRKSFYISVPPNPTTRGKEAIEMASAAMSLALLDVWTVNNKRLRDCTGEDLDLAIDDLAEQVAGANQKVRFYKALRAKLEDEETVGEKFNNKSAQKLLNETKRK